jgi:hypothetical protein
LKKLGIYIAKDKNIIICQNSFIIAGSELIVEIPGRDGLNLVPAIALQSFL